MAGPAEACSAQAECLATVARCAQWHRSKPAQLPFHIPFCSEQDEYQGNLGPVLRAEVGDTIEVVFKNSLRYPGK